MYICSTQSENLRIIRILSCAISRLDNYCAQSSDCANKLHMLTIVHTEDGLLTTQQMKDKITVTASIRAI